MANKSKIEWLNGGSTWNPVTGCTPISEGCAHCYARRMARRLAGRAGYPGVDGFAVTMHPERLEEPLHWRKPRMIFVCSMGDLFHEEVSDGFIRDVWHVMADCPQHTFQVLTKRPQRMYEWVREYGAFALSHIWLGTTAENQPRADERVRWLLRTPAAVRFVSYEPALGPWDASRWLGLVTNKWGTLAKYRPDIDWVIVGGETGPGARPMHPAWVRSIRDQCQAANVPLFLKSWGDWLPYEFATEAQRAQALSQISLAGDERGGHRDVGHWLRVGKRASGALLDSREWREFPQ